MYRTKDFDYMKVLNTTGKKIGYIKDILIDFHASKVVGFLISPLSLFSKKQTVFMENVISINKVMIIKGNNKQSFICFKDIKDIEIFNLNGEMLGVLEDILIDSYSFTIKGLIVASGLIHKLLHGKNIILPSNCILGEDFILHHIEENKINLISIPHKSNHEGYYE